MNMAKLEKKLQKANADYADAVASITLTELLEGITCPIKASKIEKTLDKRDRIMRTIEVRKTMSKINMDGGLYAA